MLTVLTLILLGVAQIITGVVVFYQQRQLNRLAERQRKAG